MSLKRSKMVTKKHFLVACKYGLVNIVKYLLPYVKIESDLRFPLGYKFLMHNKFNLIDIKNSICKAFKYDHLDIFKLLIYKVLIVICIIQC